MTTATAEYEELLSTVMRRVVAGRLELPETGLASVPLCMLGLDSVSRVSFYTQVEIELDRPWDEDVPHEALSSIEAMAAYLLDNNGPLRPAPGGDHA